LKLRKIIMRVKKYTAIIFCFSIFIISSAIVVFGYQETVQQGSGTGPNVAFGKVATQSSTVVDAAPSRASDGNRNGDFANGSVTHTDFQNQPWWQVDLGTLQPLDSVAIWNRTDCCGERLANFYILVSDTPFTSTDLTVTLNQPEVSSYYIAGGAGQTLNINIGRTGRYVRVQLAGANFLSLAEVEVRSVDDDTDVNDYIFNFAGQASASSSYITGNFPASSMVNGDRKGLGWGMGTGGWNDNTPNAFPDTAEIQLNGEKFIEEVDVFTLQDNPQNPTEPDPAMTFSLYGIVDFDVNYWNSTTNQWVLISQVRGNNKVWRQLRFPPVTTSRIQIVVRGSLQSFSRITEIEAWGKEDGIRLITAPVGPPDLGAPDPCQGKKNSPCAPTITLADSIRGVEPRYTNYRGWLDWNFKAWVELDSSKNLPVLAHAITLWRLSSEWNPPPNPPRNPVQWWLKFLNCQVGDPACPSNAPPKLKVMKADELLSNTYDADTTRAVVSVFHWAGKQMVSGNQSAEVSDLAFKSRLYLEKTWGMYVLGAGYGPSKSIVHYGNRDLSSDRQRCDRNGSSYWYTGAFMALAGMRSAWGHLCEEDRGPLFMRALAPEWPGALPSSVPVDMKTLVKAGESSAQWELLDLIQQKRAQFPSNPNFLYKDDNAYGLHAGLRAFMVGLIVNGGGSETIRTFMQGTNLPAEYHFLGWTDAGGRQVRMTVMKENNSAATIPTYAVLYRSADNLTGISGVDRTAEAMIPFSSKSISVQDLLDWRRTQPRADREEIPERAPDKCFRSEACYLAKDDDPETCYFEPGELGNDWEECWTRQERGPGVTVGSALLLNNSSETFQDFVNPTRLRVTNLRNGEFPHIKHGTSAIVDWINPLGIQTKLYHIGFIPNTNPNLAGSWVKYW
jgi:hypothetical protein